MKYDDIIEYGTIVAVDLSSRALVKVQVLDRVTDWFPYKMKANSHIKVWTPPQINEQVVVVFPDGDGDSGFVTGSLYNSDCKEPEWANGHTSGVEFSDGTIIKYDTEAKAMSISAVGSVALSAPSGVTIMANTDITGDVSISGALHVSGTIRDEKGSLSSHVHTGVQSGSSSSGARP